MNISAGIKSLEKKLSHDLRMFFAILGEREMPEGFFKGKSRKVSQIG